jgi:RNA polymerase-binding transcription factor DksA
MDSADLAQMNMERQQAIAQHKYFDLPPLPPAKCDAMGRALCLDCDIDIEARRRAVPNTQRCVECQSDFEKRSR